MRKLMMILTLTVSLLGLTAVSDAMAPPACGSNCPFIR